MKVTEIMSRSVITVTPATPIKEAARLLVEHGVSALPVLDAGGELVGIVSEADLIKVEARPDTRSQATPLAPSAGTTPRMVSDVMNREVISVKAATEVSQAVRTMLDAGIKRVPVLDDRRVIGVVSRRDLMRLIARSDPSVRHDVEEKIKGLGVSALISVDGGVVTVGGTPNARERRVVQSTALSVPGVLEVRFAG